MKNIDAILAEYKIERYQILTRMQTALNTLGIDIDMEMIDQCRPNFEANVLGLIVVELVEEYEVLRRQVTELESLVITGSND